MFPISSQLKISLDKLTDYLRKHQKSATFQIIGSFAMELKGYKRDYNTTDIDLIKDIEDDQISEEINRIGEELKDSMWMNLSSETIPRPDGFDDRVEIVEYNERITFLVPSKKDMIILKVSALIDRGQEDAKDFSDLLILKPTSQDFELAADFYRNHRMEELRGTKFEKLALERIEWARRKLGF